MAFTYAEFDQEFTRAIQDSFANGIDKRLDQGYFNKFVYNYDTVIGQEEFTSTEGMDSPDYVDERENLKETSLEKGYKVAFTGNGFGHRCIISKEARVQARDSITILREHLSNKMVSAVRVMARFVEEEGHRFLNQAFTAAPVVNWVTSKPISLAAPDGAPLIDAAHTWKTGGNFSNLLSGWALTLAKVEEVERIAGEFVWPDGTRMPLTPSTIIVKKGGAASVAAKQIFGIRVNSDQYRVPNTGDLNIYSTGQYTIVETPYLNSGTAHFFMADEVMNDMDNPLFLSFQQRPRMEGLQQMSNNLDRVYPYYSHMKYGIRNMPYGIRGSTGV